MNICRGLLRNSSTRLCIAAVLVAVAIAILRGGVRLVRHSTGIEIESCLRSIGRVGITSETPGSHPAQEFIRVGPCGAELVNLATFLNGAIPSRAARSMSRENSGALTAPAESGVPGGHVTDWTRTCAKSQAPVDRCTRSDLLPLLPSGPGGVHRATLRGTSARPTASYHLKSSARDQNGRPRNRGRCAARC